MKVIGTVFFLAASLVLILSGRVLACPSYLECGNFTQTDKIADCNFIVSHGFSHNEEQSALCVLWDEDYAYPEYQPVYQQLQPNVALQSNPISNSSFLLAGKIGVFLIFNYFLFSLTKSSFLKRWFNVVSQT
jgi:hypothetical protein